MAAGAAPRGQAAREIREEGAMSGTNRAWHLALSGMLVVLVALAGCARGSSGSGGAARPPGGQAADAPAAPSAQAPTPAAPAAQAPAAHRPPQSRGTDHQAAAGKPDP